MLSDAHPPRRGASATYRPAGIDEMVDGNGVVRPHYRSLVDALAAMPPAEQARRQGQAEQYLREAGVYYRDPAEGAGATAAEHAWPLAFLPLVIDAAEWRGLETALIQRARFLESLLADVYGGRALVVEGLLPGTVLAGNREFLHPLADQGKNGLPLLGFVAMDLMRGTDGVWRLLGDRTQAPSGAGFALENRVATARAFPELVRDGRVRRLAGFFQGFRDALHAWNASLGGEAIGILSPGLMSETSYEHAYLARYLGFQLVEGGDLTVRQDHVFVRSVDGDRPVAVLWRRLDADFADPVELNGESRIGTAGLSRTVRAGNLLMVNALGSGFLEDPSLAPYMDALAERLIGETLLLRPAEQTSTPSTAPVLSSGSLSPRPVTLRVFLARGRDGWHAMPGGFARVAEAALPGAAIRAGGRSVDVWVLSDGPRSNFTLLARDAVFSRRLPGALPARAADNLFWLGRQVERLEQASRIMRTHQGRQADAAPLADVDSALRGALMRFGLDADAPLPGLAALAGMACDIASRIRDRFSPDGWRVLSEIPPLLAEARPATHAEAAAVANGILGRLSGFTGLVEENMYRLNGWRFLQCGRRIERGIAFCESLADLVRPDLGDEALDAILELADSRLTYRRRYSVELWRHAVLDLSVLDPLNPRSVTFLAEELDSIIHALPGFQAGEPLTQPGRRIARLAVRLRTADPREVDAAFLKRVAQDMRDISELLSERYFAPASGHLSAYGGSTVE
ncbi:circularly permuted type 2 ATP-grasp protein [Aureimonas altamirensis]|uniref:circularly permuted type 2 ATP-grasp protein n=1 Tax=Aureimonas altamirensis TaxID=370622 RepID=UPI002557A0AE|nr:circularly permuted type 2 ATP-grasp protein [Aureimonas altamirensis]